MDLLRTVLDGIEKRRDTWPRLAADADVSYSWMTKLMAGNITNPGILPIQRLAVGMGINRIKKDDD